MRIYFRRTLLLMAVIGIAACDSGTGDAPTQNTAPLAEKAKAAATAKTKEWNVIEAFEIGKNIYVRSLAIDQNAKSLWVGTSAGVLEVSLSSRDVLNTYTRAHGLANEYVFAIAVDSTGTKWFGTNGGGVTRFKDGQWKTYFPMHGLADYWVYSFGEQTSNNLWIGTWAGANRLDVTSGTFQTYVKELVNEWVYGIAVDEKKRVWFGTEGGVSMYDGTTWREWTHQQGLGAPNKSNLPPSTNTGLGTRSRHDLNVEREGQATYNPGYVFCIHAAKDGNIWAGTWGGGVSRYDGKAWRNYTTADGLAGDIVFSMAEDKNGVLWFGTNQGLSSYDGKTWLSFRQDRGLSDLNIYAVAATADDEIWLGAKGAVMRFGRQSPSSNPEK